MKSLSLGKILLSLVGLFSIFGAYIADWNRTHIFNPLWPPHAKFHNAQTMLMGTVLGLSSLWMLWFYKGDKLTGLRFATFLASAYWITQAGAILFPGTALVDPEFSHPGQLPAQLILDAVTLVLLSIAYIMESKRIKKYS
jgi:hypothetical protein